MKILKFLYHEIKKNFKPNTLYSCKCNYFKSDEKPVQNGLCLSPQKIKALTERGIPVSLPNLSIIDDADVPASYLPLEHKRGVDLNTCFEASTTLKRDTIKTYKYLKSKQ